MIRKLTKVNFKFYDVTGWKTNNYNTHITQYFKKKKQSGNEIWLTERKLCKKSFFFKNNPENETERLVPDFFLFFKKLLCKINASGFKHLSFNTALQIVAGHWSLPTIWVSWSVKIDADFLK